MLSLPLMLLLFATGMAVIAKLLIPVFEKYEQEVHLRQLEAVKAVQILKNKVKPGIYTFRWGQGQMLEPVFEKQDGRKVIVRFADGDRVTEKIQEMPTEFHRQLLELIRSGMVPKNRKATER